MLSMLKGLSRRLVLSSQCLSLLRCSAMKLILIFLTVGCTIFAYVDYFGRFNRLTGCSDMNDADTQFLFEFNGNEVVHVNFQAEQDVITLPSFTDSVSIPHLYNFGISIKNQCLRDINYYKKSSTNPQETAVAPQIHFYSKDEVVPGVENTFVCYVTEFYPPQIKMVWTRNDENVTGTTHTSQFSLNTDGTFNIFTSLNTTPADGDRYHCTVEHQALDQPQSKILDVYIPTFPHVRGSTVYCGVGLAIGILGVATAITLFIKGRC